MRAWIDLCYFLFVFLRPTKPAPSQIQQSFEHAYYILTDALLDHHRPNKPLPSILGRILNVDDDTLEYRYVLASLPLDCTSNRALPSCARGSAQIVG